MQDLEGRLQTAQHQAYLAETKAQAASDALATVRQRYSPAGWPRASVRLSGRASPCQA